MARKNIHDFSESGLHMALLAALLLLLLAAVVESFFLTPEGRTPVLWRLDRVEVSGSMTGR